MLEVSQEELVQVVLELAAALVVVESAPEQVTVAVLVALVEAQELEQKQPLLLVHSPRLRACCHPL